uniref:Synaptotagmin like 1 n=1 Tax=Pelodiscus sinensis TaxID=13735 RepID=K7F6X2_PELSI
RPGRHGLSVPGLWACPVLAPGPQMDIDTDALLDLSFLTEEEQEAIVEVLRRDSRLRVQEEGRISKLRESVSDPNQLKILTGAWFCDVRAKRHRHNHFGSDIVRASIRRKKKPKAWGEMDGADGGLIVGKKQKQEDRNSRPTARRGRAGATKLPSSLTPASIPFRQSAPPRARLLESTNPSSGEEEEMAADPSPALPPAPRFSGSPRRGGVLAAARSSPGGSGRSACGPPPARHSVLEPARQRAPCGSKPLSGSMMSLYSDSDVGQVEVQGCIQFSLQYEARKKELQIQVIQCRDLAAAKKQRSDPYVKSYLLPDKSNHSKRKTAVKKRSLDPVFNEALKYKIEKVDLQGRILNLSVWHHDSLGRNLFMGEVELAGSTWDWSNTGPAWFNLQPRHPLSPGSTRSRRLLPRSLQAPPVSLPGDGLPPTGELHIWVKAAQSLIPIRSGTMDSFIQCYVLPDDSKTSCQKTRVVKRSLSPVFNHTMVYDGFQAKDLREACAEFTLWEHETFAKQQLGGIRLSLGTGSSYRLPVVWERLLDQPLQWVEALLPLRTNLTPRT